MSQATVDTSWYEEIREEALARNPFRNSPYFKAFAQGKLTREQARGYADQNYFIIEIFPQLFSSIHGRCDDLEVRKMCSVHLSVEDLGFFKQNIGETPDHVELFKRIRDDFGIHRDQYHSIEPMPETIAVNNFLRHLASEAPWQVALAVFSFLEAMTIEISKLVGTALIEHYGVRKEWGGMNYTIHEEAEAMESGETNAVVLKYLDNPEHRKMVRREVDNLVRHFWLYADGLHRRYVLQQFMGKTRKY